MNKMTPYNNCNFVIIINYKLIIKIIIFVMEINSALYTSGLRSYTGPTTHGYFKRLWDIMKYNQHYKLLVI